MLFGGDIVRSGLSHVDAYSFTSDVSWVNHEWLAELAMYAAYAAAGGAGLVLLKAVVIIGAVALAHAPARRCNADPVATDALLVVLAAGVWVRSYVARPQIFSLLLFACLLWILRRVESGRRHWLVAVPALFALWVNLHGGWVVGLGVLALWSAITFVTTTPKRGSLLVASAAAAAATLCNPYGAGMWSFLSQTVRPDRPYIDDWRPLLSTPPVFALWIPVALTALYPVLRQRREIPWSHLAVVVGLGAASLRVSRLDAFFAIAAISLLGDRIVALRSRGAARSPALPIGLSVAAALCAVMIGVILLRGPLGCVRMNGLAWLPESDVVQVVKPRHLRGRLLSWFGWGEYAIWHLEPDLKVSFDGRRETVYSDAFAASHVALYWTPERERDFLEKLNADYAWLPRDIPLSATLQREGWSVLFAGPRSVFLARAPLQPAEVSGRASFGRCFPGP